LPRLIAWEVTRSCYLRCKHCRAGAEHRKYENEFSTEECFRLLENIAGFCQPIIILTGGEPMLRDDIYEIARHGHELGLRMVMAPCGELIDDGVVKRMLESGIQCISISLDGATAKSHDGFRQVEGAYAGAIKAIEAAKRNGLAFQINTTITKHNLDELGEILHLAERLGAITFNPFLLVPTGRGKALAEQEISPEQYEDVLHWLNEQRGQTKMAIRVTCAPHYQRIIRQHPQPIDKEGIVDDHPFNDSAESQPPPSGAWRCHPMVDKEVRSEDHPPRRLGGCHPEPGTGHGPMAGCMGGKSFAFISHVGKVQICGFLEESAGDLRETNLDFETIWKNSAFLQNIRAVDEYKGKCGWCEYRYLCGGCRARAYALTGDYLESEPFCVYEPRRKER